MAPEPTRRRLAAAVGLIASAALLTGATSAATSAAQTDMASVSVEATPLANRPIVVDGTSAPTVRWDYSMPPSVSSDRPDDIAVSDRLGKVRGFRDYGNVRWGPLPRNGRYLVNLDACKSRTMGEAKYRFQVPAAKYDSQQQRSCQVQARLPEGQHKISITVSDRNGLTTQRSTIDVRNLLVVIMGDSYTSGVGFPTLDGGKTPWLTPDKSAYVFDDPECARTRWGGYLRSIVGLEQADPRSNVTVIDVSCGGARTAAPGGLLYPQNDRPAQIDQIRDMIGNRTIDLLQFGIGGNDVGFGLIVETCAGEYLKPGTTSCWDASIGQGTTLNEAVQARLAALKSRFAALDRCLGGTGCKTWKQRGNKVAARATSSKPLKVDESKVLQTLYPNLVRNERGRYCNTANLTAPLKTVDSQWADRGVVRHNTKERDTIKIAGRPVPFAQDGLNTQILQNGREFGYRILTNTFKQTFDRGMCSTDPAIYPPSFLLNPFPDYSGPLPRNGGVVHPNDSGQQLYNNTLFRVSKKVTGLPVGDPSSR